MALVDYRIDARCKLLGRMEVPDELLDQKADDELWGDATEKYLIEHHDFLMQPPEIEEDEMIVEDVELVDAKEE